MITPAAMMEELLNNACSNPGYMEFLKADGRTAKFGNPDHEGYDVFNVELCCKEYNIVAKKEMGHWVIHSFESVGG
jgi:hypothetical protein